MGTAEALGGAIGAVAVLVVADKYLLKPLRKKNKSKSEWGI
jgi:hypothetical protein